MWAQASLLSQPPANDRWWRYPFLSIGLTISSQSASGWRQISTDFSDLAAVKTSLIQLKNTPSLSCSKARWKRETIALNRVWLTINPYLSWRSSKPTLSTISKACMDRLRAMPPKNASASASDWFRYTISSFRKIMRSLSPTLCQQQPNQYYYYKLILIQGLHLHTQKTSTEMMAGLGACCPLLQRIYPIRQ